jgi:hypothetical protein
VKNRPFDGCSSETWSQLVDMNMNNIHISDSPAAPQFGVRYDSQALQSLPSAVLTTWDSTFGLLRIMELQVCDVETIFYL